MGQWQAILTSLPHPKTWPHLYTNEYFPRNNIRCNYKWSAWRPVMQVTIHQIAGNSLFTAWRSIPNCRKYGIQAIWRKHASLEDKSMKQMMVNSGMKHNVRNNKLNLFTEKSLMLLWQAMITDDMYSMSYEIWVQEKEFSPTWVSLSELTTHKDVWNVCGE